MKENSYAPFFFVTSYLRLLPSSSGKSIRWSLDICSRDLKRGVSAPRSKCVQLVTFTEIILSP